jgi:hypothetical protein
LTVRGDGPKRYIAETGARRLQHRRRDVCANHESRRFDDGRRDQRGLAWSCGNIEHSTSARYLGGSQHSRHEELRPTTDVLPIRGGVDGPPGCGVESRSEVLAHQGCPAFIATAFSCEGVSATGSGDFDARARRKQSLNALKKAIARMRSFIHKLRSLPGRKVIPLGTSTELQNAANPILADMKTLRTAL